MILSCRRCGARVALLEGESCQRCGQIHHEQCVVMVSEESTEILNAIVFNNVLPVREPETDGFGRMKWDYSDIALTLWEEVLPRISEAVVSLHKAGLIQYGSW